MDNQICKLKQNTRLILLILAFIIYYKNFISAMKSKPLSREQNLKNNMHLYCVSIEVKEIAIRQNSFLK